MFQNLLWIIFLGVGHPDVFTYADVAYPNLNDSTWQQRFH